MNKRRVGFWQWLFWPQKGIVAPPLWVERFLGSILLLALIAFVIIMALAAVQDDRGGVHCAHTDVGAHGQPVCSD